MKFDVYGRFTVEVVRDGDRWRVYRLGNGTRRLEREIVLPGDAESEQLEQHLDDLLHELGRPGSAIRRLG